MSARSIKIGDLALNERGAFKIGPFGSSLKKSELVDTGIPVVGIENVLPNQFENGFRRFIAPAKFSELSDYEIAADDVLVTTMGTIGRAAVVPHKLGKAIFDSHLFRMRVDTDRIFPAYLCYAINSSVVDIQLQRMARGAIMQGLNTTILRECDIPLPDLSEQKRIAWQLEQADRFCRTRCYALELSDTFLLAAFIALFGDPVHNERGWRLVPIMELGDVSTGGTPSGSENGMFGSAVPFITPGDLEKDTANSARFLSEAGAAVVGTVRAGTTLVCCIGATIGKTDKTQIRSAFNQQINAIEWGSSVDDDFGFYLMRFYSRVVVERGRSTTLPILKKSSFEDITVPVPPKKLQQYFAALVKRHERLRASQREALRQADHLFQSLLHRAFSENG